MNPSLESRPVPRLAREPYLLFFPLGALFAVWGLGPWLLFGVGVSAQYPSLFHSIVQVEGFLASYALGFLFTFVPRRTRTAPPKLWHLFAAAMALVAIAALAWFQQWVASQALWVALLLALLVHGALRVRRSGEGLPDGAFVWLPFGFVTGALGAILTAVAPSFAMKLPMLHAVGQALLTQGLFTGLIVGIGRMVLPMVLHAEGSPSGPRGTLWHSAFALMLLGTFLAELFVAGPITYMARALLVGGLVWFSLEMYSPPRRPGAHRFLIWASVWMLPLGYGLMAFFPGHRVAAEHVVFVGSFGLMVLAVSTHVVLSHGGFGALLQERPWQLWALGTLVAFALAFRVGASLDPAHLRAWLGAAAGSFLAATTAWALLLAPKMLATSRS